LDRHWAVALNARSLDDEDSAEAHKHTSDTVQLSGSDSSLPKIQVCWAVNTLCRWVRGLLQCLEGHGALETPGTTHTVTKHYTPEDRSL
jgi:hypothetical protein